MTEVHETPLPGVGVRHDFKTKAGDYVGVISHHTGRRDLLVFDREDPDACRLVLRLAEEDGFLLGEMLGAAKLADPINNLQQTIAGITIDWIPIRENWPCAGHSLQELDIRANTGVTIVAVVRNDDTFPAPGADFRLFAGDTAVVIGSPGSIKQAFELMRGE